jgi:outer membrane protein assembly factor BamE
MTRDQVRFVLGTPLLTDIFHDNRWDYVYRRQRANSREVEERRLSVFFENDRLVRVEGDVTTGLGTAAPPGKAAEQTK